jgi:hypothetical protein
MSSSGSNFATSVPALPSNLGVIDSKDNNIVATLAWNMLSRAQQCLLEGSEIKQVSMSRHQDTSVDVCGVHVNSHSYGAGSSDVKGY